ncbi:MAG: phosphotransferase [Rhodoferax sp.]|nr:phosphotransferase [Rhodoferax sp.]
MLIETLGAARDMGRLRQIAGVFVRHGLGDTVRRLGLADRLERAGHALHWDHAADLARLEPPVQVRKAMEELGPTFIKLGQILAGRSDIFGPDWIEQFQKLHSRVPALPLEALRPQLREDLGGEPEEVFLHFEEQPLAAASIAQVYRATLKDGTLVIVKIRRPEIKEVIEADLRLLGHLASLVEAEIPSLKPYRPQQLVREFAKSLRRELNLTTECRNAERIAANMVGLPFIVVPRVHWAYTSERINVQDYVGGVPGEQLAKLNLQAGFDRPLLAQRGAQAVLKMIVQDGFFHADPHPGNVFYLPDNRIAFIDFGMVGHLPQRRREELLQLLLGLVERESQTVADVLLDWTGDDHAVNLQQLESEIEVFVDQYHGTPLADLSLGQMLSDVTSILREHQLGLPSDLALLIKAFISLEGMGRGLDPGFHMASQATPMLRQVVRAAYQPRALALRGWKTLRRTLAFAEQLPHDLSRLIRNARRGRIHIGIELEHLRRVGDQIDRAANRLAMALVIAALIIGSSIVMNVQGGPTLLGLPMFGLLGFVGAVLGGLWLVRAIWRSGRGNMGDGS